MIQSHGLSTQIQGAVAHIDAVVSAATGVTMRSQGYGGFLKAVLGHGSQRFQR